MEYSVINMEIQEVIDATLKRYMDDKKTPIKFSHTKECHINAYAKSYEDRYVSPHGVNFSKT